MALLSALHGLSKRALALRSGRRTMSRVGAIGTLGSVSLGLLNNIRAADKAASRTAERLSTLRRINRAGDDPAGTVVAHRLQANLQAAGSTSSHIPRAKALIGTADTAVNQIVEQLTAARTLVLEAAGDGLSSGEVQAKQVELDGILEAIDRSARTEFNGRRLLDGTAGYTVTGIDSAEIADVDVIDKQTTDDVTVSMTITTQAARGTKAYAGGALGADATLTVSGPEGSTVIELASGATTQDITDAFNAVSELTGVTATRVDATNITFRTEAYGADASFTITPTTGSFTTTGTGTGTDAVATINGRSVTADGTRFSVNTNNVALQIEIDPAASGAVAAFTVQGQGLQFQLSTDVTDEVRIGLANMTTAALGGSAGKLSTLRSGNANDLGNGSPLTSLQVIDDALAEARLAQARIGGFEAYTLDAAESVVESQTVHLTEAYSDVMDIDVAEETARLAQQQLLQTSSQTAMQLFTLQSQNVLSLLQMLAARS